MSIATALFSDSQSRVIQWLFGQPERSYHLSELRRLTGLGSASLQRELNKLAEAQLVNSERVGNLRRFQANPKSPVYNELIALTQKTLGVVPMVREALQPLASDLKAVAKGTDTAKSDIDVLLVGNNLTLTKVLELLVPLESQLGRKINPTCFTPTEFNRRVREPGSFVKRILAQPLLPLIGDLIGADRAR
jgi:DNA-binding transcriptional ArsR family regulator